jgi:hypothetical protein
MRSSLTYKEAEEVTLHSRETWNEKQVNLDWLATPFGYE